MPLWAKIVLSFLGLIILGVLPGLYKLLRDKEKTKQVKIASREETKQVKIKYNYQEVIKLDQSLKTYHNKKKEVFDRKHKNPEIELKKYRKSGKK